MNTKRQHSVPYLEQELRLHSEHAQHAFRRVFPRVSRALYAIDVIMHLIGNDKTAAKAAESVNALIDRCASDLREDVARYQKLCKDNGVPDRVKFTNPMMAAVRISSPFDSRYLALLLALDDFVSVTEVLRITAVFDAKQKEALLNAQYTARQRVMNVGSRIIGHANAAWETAAKAGKKQEAADAGAVEPTAEDASDGNTETTPATEAIVAEANPGAAGPEQTEPSPPAPETEQPEQKISRATKRRKAVA